MVSFKCLLIYFLVYIVVYIRTFFAIWIIFKIFATAKYTYTYFVLFPRLAFSSPAANKMDYPFSFPHTILQYWNPLSTYKLAHNPHFHLSIHSCSSHSLGLLYEWICKDEDETRRSEIFWMELFSSILNDCIVNVVSWR